MPHVFPNPQVLGQCSARCIFTARKSLLAKQRVSTACTRQVSLCWHHHFTNRRHRYSATRPAGPSGYPAGTLTFLAWNEPFGKQEVPRGIETPIREMELLCRLDKWSRTLLFSVKHFFLPVFFWSKPAVSLFCVSPEDVRSTVRGVCACCRAEFFLASRHARLRRACATAILYCCQA